MQDSCTITLQKPPASKLLSVFPLLHCLYCYSGAGEWVRGFRTVKHAQTDTTGVCEGWHSSIKDGGLAEKRRLLGRKIDWLLYKLFYEVLVCLKHVNSSNLHSACNDQTHTGVA